MLCIEVSCVCISVQRVDQRFLGQRRGLPTRVRRLPSLTPPSRLPAWPHTAFAHCEYAAHVDAHKGPAHRGAAHRRRAVYAVATSAQRLDAQAMSSKKTFKGGASIQDRLKKRWGERAGGPDVEAQLQAAKEELARRENLQSASARGISVPSDAVPSRDAAKHAEKVLSQRAKVAKGPGRVGTGPNAGVVIEELSSSESEDDEPPPKRYTPQSKQLAPGKLIGELRAAANAALQGSEPEEAIALYTELVETHGAELDADAMAVLLNNRALAQMRLENYESAELDSERAHRLRPAWAKALYRKAQAQCELQKFRQAIAACREGERLLEQQGDRSAEFTPLMDRISYVAALHGSLAGFDGRLIQIRSAGEDAWLAKEAPVNVLYDSEDDEEKGWANDNDHHETRAPDILTNAALATEGVPAAADAVLGAERAAMKAARNAGQKVISVRGVHRAAKIAKDGDRFMFLKGVHNIQGDAITLNKRVLIRGEGHMDEVTLDNRANSPMFRILRNCVIQNLEWDMIGFRECCLVTGGEDVRPIIETCVIKCSGDDAVNVTAWRSPCSATASFTARSAR